MHPTFLLALSAVLLSACASTAPAQMYRPSGSIAAPHQIDGEYNDFDRQITIRIDGKPALSGRLSLLTSRAELSGQHNGKAVAASCQQIAGLFQVQTQCLVFMDNERAATLQF